jgi:hypothetical protein
VVEEEAEDAWIRSATEHDADLSEPLRSVHRGLLLCRTHADRRVGWRAARRSARTGRGAHTMARRARVSCAAFFRSRSSDGDRGGSHRDSEPLVDPHPNPPPRHGGGSMNLPRVGGHSGQVQREYLLCRTLPGSGSSGRGSCPHRRCALRLVCRRWTRDLIELL